MFLDSKGFRAKRLRNCRFAVELITKPSDPVLLDLGLKVQARFLDDGGIQCQQPRIGERREDRTGAEEVGRRDRA